MAATLPTNKQAIEHLRLQWTALAAILGLSLGAGYMFFQNAWEPAYAWRWLWLATALCAYLLWVLWRGLPANHRAAETTLLPGLGAGNLLTLGRGALLAGLAGFLFSPRPPGWLGWLPGLFYTLSASADLFDGYLARRSNRVTRLGEVLDLSLDGLGVLIACTLVVQYGQVPWWYLSVGLARYVFIFAIWLRRRLSCPVYDLAPSPLRRPFAGAQMGFIAAVLFPLFSPPGTGLAAALFALPFLIGFAFDTLTVCGVVSLKPGTLPLIHRESPWGRLLSSWLPFILRVLVVGLLLAWLAKYWMPEPSLEIIPGWTLSPGYSLVWLLGAAGMLLLAVGAAGRVAAILVLMAVGAGQGVGELGVLEVFLLGGGAALFFLGTGPYSLWSPERVLIAKRIGEVSPHDA